MLLGLRRAAGLTQEELGEAAGLTARSIRDLERDRRQRPQRHTVEALVAALGLTGADAALLLQAGCSGHPRELASDGGGAVLLDRGSQLAALERAAAAARTGRGSVVLVRAGAGMGKTSLVRAWTEAERARGMLVVWASGGKLEQDFAFAVLRQLVEPLLARAGAVGRERLLSGPAESASYALRVDAEPAGAGPSAALMGILHALYWLMVHVTDDGPLALVVDDAHWADGPSARWLEYLARRLQDLPLVLVVAARPEGDTQVGPLLEQIAARSDCERVDLPALTAAGVTAMVRARLGGLVDPGFAGACAEASGGNPLLLGELLRTLADNGVEPVAGQARLVEKFRGQVLATTVVERLASQPEPVRRLARALVVLGDGASWRIAAVLAGLDEAQARRQARLLQQIGVLTLDVIGAVAPGARVRFSHPLVRAAIGEAVMSAAELAAGHARAAELLRADGAHGDVVAGHLLLAEPGGQPWRVEVLREAARTARDRGAPQSVIRYLRRALCEPVTVEQRAPLLLELGMGALPVDLTTAAHHLAEARAALTDPSARAQTAQALATALHFQNQHARAVDVLEQAVAELAHSGDSGSGRELSWHLQAQIVMIGSEELSTVPAARSWADRLSEHKLAGDTPGQCAVLVALTCPAFTGDISAAATNDLLDRAHQGPAEPTETLVGITALRYTATDRLDDAAVRFQQIANVCARTGSFGSLSGALVGQLNLRARRGHQLGLTPDLGHAGFAHARVRMMLVTQLAESSIERGDLAAAATALVPDPDIAQMGWVWQGPLQLIRARLHTEQGNPTAALAVLLEYGAQERAAQVTNLAMAPWRSQAALAHLALGQRSDAVRLAAAELEAAHRWGTDRAIGLASRCLAVATGGRDGLALLRQAIVALERSPARLELARAHYEFGVAATHAQRTPLYGDKARLFDAYF
ncbi:AAA family ATPase, partial [Streptomyces sp. NPDC005534]|uniref:ATP-binding protein n=1 Tax=Streptomyces sp. NPDC005534 TaxID=3155714 RepID=UPI0034548E4A